MWNPLRRAVCPNENCRRPLIFDAVCTHVKCRFCPRQSIPVQLLTNVIRATKMEEDQEWLESRAYCMEMVGKFGRGRTEMANRMIDGILSYGHATVMWDYFEFYGVTKSGQVQRLAEMGRIEPINVSNISDYAIGIRNEHVDLLRYGKNLATAEYLSAAIKAISRINGIDENSPSLVPLSVYEDSWLRNASMLASRACVGEEVFGKRIMTEIASHLQAFTFEYQRRSNYKQDLWSMFRGEKKLSESAQANLLHGCTLDLAAMANVLCRSILLLDAEPPFTVNVFLPLLCRLEDCQNQNGKQRPPLVFAWSNRSRWTKSILVPIADSKRISPIRLPREWFKPVWGVSDTVTAELLLSDYLDFDEENRCLVANGKYFKPEYLRRIVTAFEKEAVTKGHVHPALKYEWIRDFQVQKTKGVESEIVRVTMDGNLMRCVECETLTSTEDVNDDTCRFCSTSIHLRKQNMDGTVEYKTGDHTATPAPKSWCFRKRKHFFRGLECDNPPLTTELLLNVKGATTSVKVSWFCGSDQKFNSDLGQLANTVIEELRATGRDASGMNGTIAAMILEKIDKLSLLCHRLEHFESCMGKMADTNLLDGTRELQLIERNQIGQGKEAITEAVEKVFAAANEAIRGELGKRNDTGQNREADELNKTMEAMAKDVASTLSNLLYDLDQEQRWRLICPKKELFRRGGFFYHLARHRHRNVDHFELPFMGDAMFSFSGSGMEEALVVCLPGGHFPVDESVDAVCLMVPEMKNHVCDDQIVL